MEFISRADFEYPKSDPIMYPDNSLCVDMNVDSDDEAPVNRPAKDLPLSPNFGPGLWSKSPTDFYNSGSSHACSGNSRPEGRIAPSSVGGERRSSRLNASAAVFEQHRVDGFHHRLQAASGHVATQHRAPMPYNHTNYYQCPGSCLPLPWNRHSNGLHNAMHLAAAAAAAGPLFLSPSALLQPQLLHQRFMSASRRAAGGPVNDWARMVEESQRSQADSAKSDGAPAGNSGTLKPGTLKPEFKRGFIFLCNWRTVSDVLQHKTVGLPEEHAMIKELHKLDADFDHLEVAFFLFNLTTRHLHGVFRPLNSFADTVSDPNIFDGKFPVQWKFSIWGEHRFLPEERFPDFLNKSSNRMMSLTKDQVAELIQVFGKYGEVQGATFGNSGHATQPLNINKPQLRKGEDAVTIADQPSTPWAKLFHQSMIVQKLLKRGSLPRDFSSQHIRNLREVASTDDIKPGTFVIALSKRWCEWMYGMVTSTDPEVMREQHRYDGLDKRYAVMREDGIEWRYSWRSICVINREEGSNNAHLQRIGDICAYRLDKQVNFWRKRDDDAKFENRCEDLIRGVFEPCGSERPGSPIGRMVENFTSWAAADTTSNFPAEVPVWKPAMSPSSSFSLTDLSDIIGSKERSPDNRSEMSLCSDRDELSSPKRSPGKKSLNSLREKARKKEWETSFMMEKKKLKPIGTSAGKGNAVTRPSPGAERAALGAAPGTPASGNVGTACDPGATNTTNNDKNNQPELLPHQRQRYLRRNDGAVAAAAVGEGPIASPSQRQRSTRRPKAQQIFNYTNFQNNNPALADGLSALSLLNVAATAAANSTSGGAAVSREDGAETPTVDGVNLDITLADPSKPGEENSPALASASSPVTPDWSVSSLAPSLTSAASVNNTANNERLGIDKSIMDHLTEWKLSDMSEDIGTGEWGSLLSGWSTPLPPA